MATAHAEPQQLATTTLRIPERTRPHGPVTRARLRRTWIGLGVVWALGLVPVALDASDGLKAAGLGLLVPGGGFLYTADPLLFGLTLTLFLLTFFFGSPPGTSSRRPWSGPGRPRWPPCAWSRASGPGRRSRCRSASPPRWSGSS